MWQNIQKYYPPLIDILTFAIMFFMIIYVVFYYGKLPDEIPTHFNVSGEADAWGSKGALIGLIVLNFHAVFLCFVINYFLVIKTENTTDSLQLVNIPFVKKEKLTEAQIYLVKRHTARLLAFTNLFISLTFASIYYSMIQNGLGNQSGLTSSFNLFLVLIFAPAVYYTWKIYQDVKMGQSGTD